MTKGPRIVKKLIVLAAGALFAAAVATPAFAAEEGADLPHAGTDLGDQASLQRGAKLFMNYCSGCHSLKYMRYSRMAEDLGLSEDEVQANLNFTGAKPGEQVHVALTEAFPEAEFPRFSDEFWLKRMVMSAEELACLDEAGRIGDLAVQGIIDRLKPGMREVDLFNIIYDVFSAEGAENPCMVLAGSEDMRNPTSAFQRPRPIDREISTNDVLLLELGARDPHGYEAQTGKPIVFGSSLKVNRSSSP